MVNILPSTLVIVSLQLDVPLALSLGHVYISTANSQTKIEGSIICHIHLLTMVHIIYFIMRGWIT